LDCYGLKWNRCHYCTWPGITCSVHVDPKNSSCVLNMSFASAPLKPDVAYFSRKLLEASVKCPVPHSTCGCRETARFNVVGNLLVGMSVCRPNVPWCGVGQHVSVVPEVRSAPPRDLVTLCKRKTVLGTSAYAP